LKEVILLGVQIKFGKSKVKEAKTLLEKVNDVNYLKKIKRKIIEQKAGMILSKHSETISEIKVKPMPIQVDIRKTFLYKWGREEGIRE
jgi:hypothetical protein